MRQSVRGLLARVHSTAILTIGLMMALPLRAIAPLFRVEIQRIYAERIGHLALEPELLLSTRESRPARRSRTYFFAEPPVCNAYLVKSWSRVIPMRPRWLLAPIFEAQLRFAWLDLGARGWDEKHVDLRPLDQCPPHLFFTGEERVLGERLLVELGVPAGVPYVCLAVRDGAYLSKVSPERSWSYHDYRDSRIETYVDMAEWLAEQGIAVLRMGSFVEAPLVSKHELVIDYASSLLRSDFADAFIFAHCDFCISTSTGMDSVALAFRRPLGVVNLPGVGGLRLGRTTQLAMLKDVVDAQTLTRLRLSDPRWIAATGYQRSSDFAAAGLVLRDNTSQELVAFAKDMVALQSGAWYPQPGQVEFEREFLASLPGDSDRSEGTVHLSRDWLAERW